MADLKQWRIVFSNPRGGSGGACFVDAKDEAGARKYFNEAFLSSVIVSIALEPVDPCAAYERKPAPAGDAP